MTFAVGVRQISFLIAPTLPLCLVRSVHYFILCSYGVPGNPSREPPRLARDSARESVCR